MKNFSVNFSSIAKKNPKGLHMENDAGLTREQQKRSMRYSSLEGMAYALMAGLGDAYLPAAAIFLGASNFMVGLLAALPQLFGALLQFITLDLLRILKSRKAMVVAGSLLQALTWLPVIALVLWPGKLSVELIIALFSVGTGITLMVNPAWSSWISDIVPENERAHFFGSRSRLMQLALFFSTFLAGFAVRQLELGFGASLAFAAVFSHPPIDRTRPPPIRSNRFPCSMP